MAKTAEKDLKKVETKHALSPFEEMDRMFDDYFSRGWLSPFNFEWPSRRKLSAVFEGKSPQVDLIEQDDDVIIKAELPGVDKNDLDISVTPTTVSIRGTTHHEEKEEKGDYYRREISRGSYSRTLALPVEVDEKKAKATLKDGMLELMLPKAEKARKYSVKVD